MLTYGETYIEQKTKQSTDHKDMVLQNWFPTNSEDSFHIHGTDPNGERW